MPTDHLLLIVLFGIFLQVTVQATTTRDADSAEGTIRKTNETDELTSANSSFVVIDEPDVHKESFVKTEEPLLKIRPTTRGARFRKVTPSSCRTYSLSEKYRILEGVGARNQLYMAETPDEASLGFVAPSLQEQQPQFKAASADMTEGVAILRRSSRTILQ
ncbi:unnamed protein product [Strongylus vulgaris]|uniref:Uncharacterized protein n=1 Tax=Strongylus vulgaris TaxID=40348 RepID=A0A3P7ILJ3_STRVU|nr:unnamed protein product [Strongylus vulgaris]